MVHLGKWASAWPAGVTSAFPELRFAVIHAPHMVDFDAKRNGEQACCARCGAVVWEIQDGMLRCYPGTIFFESSGIGEGDRWCASCIGPEVS